MRACSDCAVTVRAPGGLQRLCSDCEGSGGCNDCEGAWAAATLRSDCEGHLGSPLYPHRYPHPLSWIRSDEEQPADLGRRLCGLGGATTVRAWGLGAAATVRAPGDLQRL